MVEIALFKKKKKKKTLRNFIKNKWGTCGLCWFLIMYSPNFLKTLDQLTWAPLDFAYCGIYLFSSSSSNKRSWHQTDHLCGPFNLLHPTFHFPCPSLETTTNCLWWLGSTLVSYGNVTLISFGTAFLAKESDKIFVSLSLSPKFLSTMSYHTPHKSYKHRTTVHLHALWWSMQL